MSAKALKQTALWSCNAHGCGEVTSTVTLFCERHDRMLQSDIKALLGKHHRPGQKHSKILSRYLEQARQEILEAQLQGHRAPRAQAFEW